MDQIYKQMVGFRKKVSIWSQIFYIVIGLLFAVIASLYDLRNFSLTNFFLLWLFVVVLGEIHFISRLFSKKYKEIKRFQASDLRNAAQAISDLSFTIDSSKSSYKYFRGVMYNPIFGIFKGNYKNKECSFYFAEDRQNMEISPIGKLITIFQIGNAINCPLFSLSNAKSPQSKAAMLAGKILGNASFKVEQTENIVMRYNPQEFNKLKNSISLDKIKQFIEKHPDAIIGAFPNHIMIQRKGFMVSKNDITNNLDLLLDIY